MIYVPQIKVSVEAVIKVSPYDKVRHGIISDEERELVKQEICRAFSIHSDDVYDFSIEKKSIDARRKNNISFVYQVQFCCKNEQRIIKKYGKNISTDKSANINKYKGVSANKSADKDRWEKVSQNTRNNIGNNKPYINSEERIVVVGTGPAGLFAALTLAYSGFNPLVIERGADVDERSRCVNDFWNGGKLNTECNVQFGEGGAGTFSDGKLNTLVKDKEGYNRRVLSLFVKFGAPSEILYLNKPHIGTDRLKCIVKAMREEIIRLGGEVCFNTKLTDIIYEDNSITGIHVCDTSKKNSERIIKCSRIILATGHSARDTFYKLNEHGVYMESKPFAVGVRVEHRQDMIGYSQYGAYYTKLPAADYKITYSTKDKRGVYSFCMCPGGYVVNASSEQGKLAINGMSNYERDGKNANSAIVVTVSPIDFGGDGALAGIEFQRRLEEKAYRQAEGKIPVQLLADFINNKKSTGFGEILPQMKGHFELSNLREVLPEFCANLISEGFNAFDRRIKGFAREDTLLSGIESRTSSPVRIKRDENFQANIRGLYPCGEGAGYAGGITSAAADGIRVAENIIKEIKSNK